jgi:hypothetical protein
MLYALLCYNDEDAVFSWTQEQDDAVMGRLGLVHERLAKAGKMGPSLRLQPTSAAVIVRQGEPMVIDGPYAETKEALLGFYVLDCENQEEAVGIARELGRANPGAVYELRPVRLFVPGVAEATDPYIGVTVT